eukprot:5661574-Pyramimonas_sp.AAC.1
MTTPRPAGRGLGRSDACVGEMAGSVGTVGFGVADVSCPVHHRRFGLASVVLVQLSCGIMSPLYS